MYNNARDQMESVRAMLLKENQKLRAQVSHFLLMSDAHIFSSYHNGFVDISSSFSLNFREVISEVFSHHPELEVKQLERGEALEDDITFVDERELYRAAYKY